MYVSESIGNIEKVKWKLKYHSGQFSVYVISFAQNSDQLDIYHSAMLQQKYLDNKDLCIVGLANSYSEAVALVQKMIEEAYLATGEADVKKYLGCEEAKKAGEQS